MREHGSGVLFGVRSLRRATLVLWGLQVAAEGVAVVCVIQPPTFPLLSACRFGDNTLPLEEVLIQASDFRRRFVTQ